MNSIIEGQDSAESIIGCDQYSSIRIRYLTAMRCVPGAVAIIAAGGTGGRSGLAATAWNSLSADPPMLLACVNRSASAHTIIITSGAFSINLLARADLETVAVFSAQRGVDGDARFKTGNWRQGANGQPMLQTAIAAFECQLVDAHAYGSHSIFIGRVMSIAGGDAKPSALLYHDGGYSLAERLQG